MTQPYARCCYSRRSAAPPTPSVPDFPIGSEQPCPASNGEVDRLYVKDELGCESTIQKRSSASPVQGNLSLRLAHNPCQLPPKLKIKGGKARRPKEKPPFSGGGVFRRFFAECPRRIWRFIRLCTVRLQAGCRAKAARPSHSRCFPIR